MKMDGECVIADFGLAVTYYEKINKMTLTSNPRVGTKRYMAPEVLDQMLVFFYSTIFFQFPCSLFIKFFNYCRMNTNYFESYKRADIYSLGLVFWEICWRTTSNGKVDEYKLPFFDCLDHGDPSFDEMRKIVCVDQRRPDISNTWAFDPVINSILNFFSLYIFMVYSSMGFERDKFNVTQIDNDIVMISLNFHLIYLFQFFSDIEVHDTNHKRMLASKSQCKTYKFKNKKNTTKIKYAQFVKLNR